MDRETAEVPVLLWLKWTPANLYDIWWQTAYLKYFDNNFVNDVNIGDYRWHFGCVIRQQKEAQSCFNLIGYFPFKTSYECNIDYKIAAYALASKIKTVMPKILNLDQNVYMKNRYISLNTRQIQDIIDYSEKNKIVSCTLFLDFS